ncbi:hypothetical protein Tfer_3287 [Thermincola ferriacetica]|uniref:Uncharacterized protein n=1 Tax=Thermincola ferriacetica TaxID=281456 RepID=A0A0L6VY48_9FIRM|nr:hypothetical protein [Thermincola ferriacetica]KNZ68180.1 hypothetical protein Tfer_3287 [Thermincola ferriacetica]
MNVFNNREIAAIIWLSVVLIYMIFKKEIRASLFEVIKSFCHRKILIPVILMILYISGIIILLHQIGFWKTSLLKDSIIWTCLTGFTMLMNSGSSKEKNFFRKTIIDNLKIVMIIEFLVNTYTFSLIGELIFLPFITLIVMMQTVAKMDEKYIKVEKLLGWVKSYIGILILIFVLKNVFSNFSSWASLDTLKQFFLAPILTIAFLPFIYVVTVIAIYELIFIRLEFGSNKSKKLKNYAKLKIIKYCLLSLKRVKDFLTHHSHNLTNIETTEDVDKVVRSLKS